MSDSRDLKEVIDELTRGIYPSSKEGWENICKSRFNTRMTIAEIQVILGKLPQGFDYWDIKISSGESLFEFANDNFSLPESFTDWLLCPPGVKNAATAAHLYMYRNASQSHIVHLGDMSFYKAIDANGESVFDYYCHGLQLELKV